VVEDFGSFFHELVDMLRLQLADVVRGIFTNTLEVKESFLRTAFFIDPAGIGLLFFPIVVCFASFQLVRIRNAWCLSISLVGLECRAVASLFKYM
jgi:hypothetical protein